jgi:hypothetical protein
MDCLFKPFTMVLEGTVDSDMCKRDFIDLCCSIGDSLDFGICVQKVIMVNMQFQVFDSNVYKNKFSFHVTFPNDRGTKRSNRKFVADKMLHLLQVLLEKDLPVGLENEFDSTGKKSFALLKVPNGLDYMCDSSEKKTFKVFNPSL